MLCKHCGKTLKSTDKFCIKCGNKVKEAQARVYTKSSSGQWVAGIDNKTIMIIGGIILGLLIVIPIVAAIVQLMPIIIIGAILYFVIKAKQKR